MAFAGHRKAIQLAHRLTDEDAVQSTKPPRIRLKFASGAKHPAPLEVDTCHTRIVPEAQEFRHKKLKSPQSTKSDGTYVDTTICDQLGNTPANSLCARHIPPDTTTEQIQDIFAQFGDVAAVEVLSQQNAAVVTFHALVDAVRAQKTLHDRCLFDENQPNPVHFASTNHKLIPPATETMKQDKGVHTATDISPPLVKRSMLARSQNQIAQGHRLDRNMFQNGEELSHLGPLNDDAFAASNEPWSSEQATAGSVKNTGESGPGMHRNPPELAERDAESVASTDTRGYTFLSSLYNTVTKSKTQLSGLPSLASLQTSRHSKPSTDQSSISESGPKTSVRSRITETPLSITTKSSRKSISIKHCRACDNVGTTGKPLTCCISCPRRYHSFCGDPRPELSKPGDFQCSHCLKKKRKQAANIKTPIERPTQTVAEQNTTIDAGVGNLELPVSAEPMRGDRTYEKGQKEKADICDLELHQQITAESNGESPPNEEFHDALAHVQPDKNTCSAEHAKEEVDVFQAQPETSDDSFSLAVEEIDIQIRQPEVGQHSRGVDVSQQGTTTPQHETHSQQAKHVNVTIPHLAANESCDSLTDSIPPDGASPKTIPKGPRAENQAFEQKYWLKENVDLIRRCRAIQRRYKNQVRCDRWPTQCSHGDECDYAHSHTPILLPQHGASAKAWTCPRFIRPGGCAVSEPHCRFSHHDTGFYVRADGRAASRKHLTCRFWYRKGECVKSDDDCYFAHAWTGLLPPLPLTDIRRQSGIIFEHPSPTQQRQTLVHREITQQDDVDQTETSPVNVQQDKDPVTSPNSLAGHYEISPYLGGVKHGTPMHSSQQSSAGTTLDPRVKTTSLLIPQNPAVDDLGTRSVLENRTDLAVREDDQNKPISTQRRPLTSKCRECGKTVWKTDLCGRCQGELETSLPVHIESRENREVLIDEEMLADLPVITHEEDYHGEKSADNTTEDQANEVLPKTIPLKRKHPATTMFATKRQKPDLSLLAKSFPKPAKPAGPDLRAPDVRSVITSGLQEPPIVQTHASVRPATSNPKAPQEIAENSATEMQTETMLASESGPAVNESLVHELFSSDSGEDNTEHEKAQTITASTISIAPTESTTEADVAVSFEEDLSDNESATICHKCNLQVPIVYAGGDVDWIQCTCCNQWYHLQCMDWAASTVDATNIKCDHCLAPRANEVESNQPPGANNETTDPMSNAISSDSEDDLPLVRRRFSRMAKLVVDDTSDSDEETLDRNGKNGLAMSEDDANLVPRSTLDAEPPIADSEPEKNEFEGSSHPWKLPISSLQSTRQPAQLAKPLDTVSENPVKPCSCTKNRSKCLHNDDGRLDGQKCYLWCASGRNRKSGRTRQDLSEITAVTNRFATFCKKHGLDPTSGKARFDWQIHGEASSPMIDRRNSSPASASVNPPANLTASVPQYPRSPETEVTEDIDFVPEAAIDIIPSEVWCRVPGAFSDSQWQAKITIRNVSRSKHVAFSVTIPTSAGPLFDVTPAKATIGANKRMEIAIRLKDNPAVLNVSTSVFELEFGFAYLKGTSQTEVKWFQKSFTARKLVQLHYINTTMRASRSQVQSRVNSPLSQPEVQTTLMNPSCGLGHPRSDEGQASRHDIRQDIHDFYLSHLPREQEIADTLRRGTNKLNIHAIKILQMAHSNMYDRHVPARPGNKSGFDYLGLRDVRNALEQLSRNLSVPLRATLEPGWVKDANDVLWKVTEDRSAAYILEQCPQLTLPTIAADSSEQIQNLGQTQLPNHELSLDTSNKAVHRPIMGNHKKPLSAGKLRFKQKQGKLSFHTSPKAPIAQSSTIRGQATFQTMLPSPRASVGRSESPVNEAAIVEQHEQHADADMVDHESNGSHSELIARMKARGIQFEDSDDDDKEDFESIPELGQHVSEVVKKPPNCTSNGLSLPKISKGAGLKHPDREQLIRHRQMSRNLQLHGNPHEVIHRQHIKDTVGRAWVDRKVEANRSRDKFAPDKVSSSVERITFGEFLGIPKNFEVEPCVIRKGGEVQLAFRERQARGVNSRPASRRRKELWPVTERSDDDT